MGVAGDRQLGGRRGRETAVEELRAAILRGDMVPGQRLVDAEMVEMFRVSRGSVRAAIDDLVAEGLVERIHNRGARVRMVPTDQAVEILECRKALEALVAAKAAERAAADDIARLRAHGDLLVQAVRDGKPAKYSTLNHELRDMIAGIAGHGTATELIARLNAQIVRHQYRLSRRPGWPSESVGRHLAVIDAVASRDPRAAERAMHDHMSSVIDALRQT